MSSSFKSYIHHLQKEVETRKNLKLEKQDLKDIRSCQNERPPKPLTEQITELMRSMPPSLVNRPWSMAELVARLKGKYRDHPHPQQVGEALRRLNWTRQRYWGKGFDGVRLWTPPN